MTELQTTTTASSINPSRVLCVAMSQACASLWEQRIELVECLKESQIQHALFDQLPHAIESSVPEIVFVATSAPEQQLHTKSLTSITPLCARFPIIVVTCDAELSPEWENTLLNCGIQEILLLPECSPLQFQRAVRQAIIRHRREQKLHQAIHTLREEADEWKTILEYAPDFIVRLNHEGQYQYVNKTLDFIRKEDILGDSWLNFVPEEEHDLHKMYLREVIRTGQSVSYETRGVGENNSVAHYYTRISPIKKEGYGHSVVVIASDITKLKAAELQLKDALHLVKERESQLFQFLEHVPIGVRVVTADGKPFYSNKKTLELLGQGITCVPSCIHELDCQTANSDESIYPIYVPGTNDAIPHDERPLAKILRGETSATAYVEVHRPKDRLQLAIAASAIHDSDGTLRYAIAAFQDVTRQMHLETQMRQSEKINALGRLSGGIAHDFNNALTAILTFGNFVLQQLSPESESHSDMQEVINAAKHAQTLTRKLLAISRPQTNTPTILNINKTIDELQKMLRRVLGGTIIIELKLDPNLKTTLMDENALEQILLNLTLNARDAMPEGGKIVITTTNLSLTESWLENKTVIPKGNYVVLSVEDTGHGIPPDLQERIFEPFFTTKGKDKGTGLGLPTCLALVQHVRGFLTVKDNSGAGTIFNVWLPTHPVDATEFDR